MSHALLCFFLVQTATYECRDTYTWSSPRLRDDDDDLAPHHGEALIIRMNVVNAFLSLAVPQPAPVLTVYLTSTRKSGGSGVAAPH